VINAMAWTLSLQFGYLAGLFSRFVMVGAPTRLMPPSTSLARAPH
jgi:hypothetical protein